MKSRKSWSKVLAVSLSAAMLSAMGISASAESSEAVLTYEPDTTVNIPVPDIEDGNILHCFDWSLSQITEELPNIAAAGFTSVQTSPVQPHDASDAWYWLYQPLGFSIGNDNGSKGDLQALCAEADNYGIKVIVDVVANHLAGSADGTRKDTVQADLNKNEYFHNTDYNTYLSNVDWGNRWQVTHCNIGMPDLNSEHEYVQKTVSDFVSELKACGVDGIRWDAAKHIGLPSESCDFWSAVTSHGLYNCGEILDGPTNTLDNDSINLMQEYSDYMNVTDDNYSGEITGALRDKTTTSSTGKWTNYGVLADKMIYFGESHDTYCNNGWTNQLSQSVIDRSYAVLSARAGAQAVYLSRPFETEHSKIFYGVKGSTHFTSPEITAVNIFHNKMIGSKEYFTTANNCFVVCREGGAVVVNAGDGGKTVTVPNGGGLVPSGTYTDKVTGSKWIVTSSQMYGTIGDTGIAVFYDDSDIPEEDVYVYFDNSSYGWNNVYAYVYVGDGSDAVQMAKWPGVKITETTSDGYFKLNVTGFENGRIIFSDGTGSASNRYPGDMQPGLEIGGSSKLFRQNYHWDNYTEEQKFEISLDKTSASVKEGQTVSLTAAVTPTDSAVVWSSSDTSIASVSNDGVVKGVKAGTATVTAYIADNPNICASAEITVTAEEAPLANVSTVSATEINLGETINVSASATGGTGSYKYQMVYRMRYATSWSTIQSYGTNATASFKPSKAGDYELCVKVKDSNNTEIKKFFNITVKEIADLENTSTLSSLNISLGDTLKVECSAKGGTGEYRYQVVYKQETQEKWSTAQSYSTTVSATIKPAKAVVYDVCVKVKDSVNTEVKKFFKVTVTDNRPKNLSTISAASVEVNEIVVVKAKASGSTGFFKYAVFYKKAADTKWTTKQNFKANSTVVIQPTKATNYDICVKVQDDKGTVVKKYFTLEVTEHSEKLINTSTVSETNIAFGETISVAASASGSTGFYQYAVSFKSENDKNFTVIQDYSPDDTAEIRLDTVGNYEVCVSVKDNLGNEAEKSFKITVS